ncbi:MAG: VWA domain-containing protein [Burkholderiales bacterium]|nr:VWA domain-containing protein [Burkholderiales bacterium]
MNTTHCKQVMAAVLLRFALAAYRSSSAVCLTKKFFMRFLRSAAFCLFAIFFFTFSALAEVVVEKMSAPKRLVEVAFVLDTTGSMASLIDGAKRKIWSIANTIVDQYPGAEIRFALVGYRDIGDEYVTKEFPLTTDIQDIYAKLLAFQAAGGGDTPESVNEALDVAVTKLGWSDKNQVKADRILFLVGDAPPHMDYKQDRKYPEVIGEAVKKGIIVNAVQAGNMASTRKVWKEIASLGRGDYLDIPQDGGRVTVIVTPYDEEILIIQRKLNLTIIPYGSLVRQREVENRAAMPTMTPAPVAADMVSFVSKSRKGEAVVTGDGDLVVDVQEGRKKLAEVPKSELPENMQKMSAGEQAAYLDTKAGERKELARQLAALVSKRDAFIFEQEKAAPPSPSEKSFDTGVKETLKKQMK